MTPERWQKEEDISVGAQARTGGEIRFSRRRLERK
jgi:hypothetical protein